MYLIFPSDVLVGHIDSARYYENEAAVAEAVAAFRAAGGARADEPVFLTTKIKSTEYAFDRVCEKAIEESVAVATNAGLAWVRHSPLSAATADPGSPQYQPELT